MSPKPSVLMILSSHSELGNTGKKIGWYLPEFAHPYHVLEPVANIAVASPKGGEAPIDPTSVETFKEDAICKEFLKNEALWKNTEVLSSFIGKSSGFDAVFVVGGHGPMFDLATDANSIKVLEEFAAAGKIVSAVCHGPAALVNVKLPSGEPLIAGNEVTAFTNAEEELIKAVDAVPFPLETKIKEQGAIFVQADTPWGAKVAIARNGSLLTGQNPASATALGEAVKKQLGL